jgi:predicted RND superfamily exporter protein
VDNNFITSNFSTSTDLASIFVVVPEGECHTYKAVDLTDRLHWVLKNTEGVQSVNSSASYAKGSRWIGNEGNLRLYSIPRDERVRVRAMEGTGFNLKPFDTASCTYRTIDLELSDHKQETLLRVTSAVRQFQTEHGDNDISFLLGTGNAANEAATNEVIDRAQYEIMVYVYCVVAFMVLVMFRSWRAVVVIIIPLALTSMLAQALMNALGIGVKVSTLPVIALGVGIGVDYGIYIYSRLRSYLNMGHPLNKAYLETLKTTGMAVSFTGITLAVGVATWIFSPIKFQADMGILLTFMFLWNMVGALTLLPALAHFLLRKSEIKGVE